MVSPHYETHRLPLLPCLQDSTWSDCTSELTTRMPKLLRVARRNSKVPSNRSGGVYVWTFEGGAEGGRGVECLSIDGSIPSFAVFLGAGLKNAARWRITVQ